MMKIITIGLMKTLITTWLISSSVQASTTQLSKLSGVIDNVDQLVHQVIGAQQALAPKATIDISTSYQLDQGLSIVIKPLKLAQASALPQTPTPVTSEKQQQIYWHKAKAMAHQARSLSMQIKSLNLSIEQSQGTKKAQLQQTLEQVRSQAQALTLQRQNHSAQNPTTAMETVTSAKLLQIRRTDFYLDLAKQITASLCNKAKWFKVIDPQEQLSIVYLQGGDRYKGGYKTKGLQIQFAQLTQCNQGKLSNTALHQQASHYQY